MTLDELRYHIDAIDEELVHLLNERARKAELIGKEKKEQGLPITDEAREKDVIARAVGLNRGPLTDEAVEEVYRNIVRVCSDVQAKL